MVQPHPQGRAQHGEPGPGRQPWMVAAMEDASRAWDETPEHLKPLINQPYFAPRGDADDQADPGPAAGTVRTLASALYGLEWQADLYATPRGDATEEYERRARRLSPVLDGIAEAHAATMADLRDLQLYLGADARVMPVEAARILRRLYARSAQAGSTS